MDVDIDHLRVLNDNVITFSSFDWGLEPILACSQLEAATIAQKFYTRVSWTNRYRWECVNSSWVDEPVDASVFSELGARMAAFTGATDYKLDILLTEAGGIQPFHDDGFKGEPSRFLWRVCADIPIVSTAEEQCDPARQPAIRFRTKDFAPVTFPFAAGGLYIMDHRAANLPYKHEARCSHRTMTACFSAFDGPEFSVAAGRLSMVQQLLGSTCPSPIVLPFSFGGRVAASMSESRKGVPNTGLKAKGVPNTGRAAKGVPKTGLGAKGMPGRGRNAKGVRKGPATGRNAKGVRRGPAKGRGAKGVRTQERQADPEFLASLLR